MSRRNRANRFTEKSDLQDNPQDSPQSNAVPRIEPIDFEEMDDESLSYFGKVSEFCGGCWETCTSFSKSAATKTWNWCQSSAQWTWGGIKAIPSYCVIRWDSTESEDELDEIESPESTVKFEPMKPEPVKADDRPIAKPVEPKKPASAVDQYDEDELAPSRWWSLGIKSAAAAAALLVLAGGYFVVAPFFNASTAEVTNIETVEPIEQPHLVAQDVIAQIAQVVPVAEIPVQVTPIAAAPEPSVAASFGLPSPPQQPENAFALPTTAPPPPQGSFLNNDPFSAIPTIPVVAEVAPTIPSDPFGVPSPAVEQSAPAVIESAAPPALAALQPLAPIEPAQITQLQPLVALNQSAFPPTAADAPAAVPAMTFAHVAANRGNMASPVFNQAPVPPSVTALPQTAVERTIAITEPVREIIPQIQHTGTIQNVSPPVVATPPPAEVPTVRSMTPESTETTPAIPRDAPLVESPPVVAPPPPPPPAPVAEFTSPQILLADTQPIDRQLWEQVHELRNRADAEPMQLRLDETMATATSEPALRFTPRNTAPRDTTPNQTAPSAVEDSLLTREAVNAFGSLLPTPHSNEIPVALSVLENAPRPVWAELAPRYRDEATNQSNQPINGGGLTFQSRIASEISRSPSETVTYTIQQGDTYMTISDKFYGTSLLYTALAAHNQQSGIGWRPTEGVVIEIPTAEFLRMHYAETMNRQERRLEVQRSAVRYIVQEGDTVFRLATDRLQDSTRWREIYAINADRLQDVRDLRPGMEILLPVEAAQRN